MPTEVPTWEPTSLSNVFEWLDEMRARPSMYLRDGTALETLEAMVEGYETALRAHRIDEGTPRFGYAFLSWVRIHRGWSMSQGWAAAVLRETPKGREPLDVFFGLVDEYRKLRPRVVATARLVASNLATGKTGTDGLGRAQAPPRELHIVQYAPAKLFLLRFVYPHVVVEQTLFDNGREETSVAFAKRWARLAFGVTAGQWRPTSVSAGTGATAAAAPHRR